MSRVVRTLWRIPRICWFLLYFLWELVLANARVAWEVVTPPHYMQAAIVRVPCRARTDFEATLFANMITMTPGTLTLELADDRSELYVHALYVGSLEGFRKQMRHFEDRMLWAVR